MTAPVEVVTENKKVVGVKCQPMRLGEFDQSGRRRPEEGGEAFVIKADQVLVAIGQTLDVQRFSDSLALEIRNNAFLKVDPVTGQTSEKWIFAGGDAVTGPSSVVEAVAAGERAAVGIDQFLTGANHAFWRGDRPVDTSFDPDADPTDTPREKLRAHSRRTAQEQLRRSRAALARDGGRPPGAALPALRLRKTLRGRRPEHRRRRRVDVAEYVTHRGQGPNR